MNDTPKDILAEHVKKLLTDPEISKKPSDIIKDLPKNLKNIPVMPLRDTVAYPGLTMPLTVGREFNKALVTDAEHDSSIVFLVTQKDSTEERPTPDGLHKIGMLARILRILTLPDGNLSVLTQSIIPARLKGITATEPYLRGDVSQAKEVFPKKSDEKTMNVTMSVIMEYYNKILSMLGNNESSQVRQAMKELDNPLVLLHFICVNSPLDTDEKQRLLETLNIKERTLLLASMLFKSQQYMELRSEIASRTQERLSQQQKEHFLRQQINMMEDELGGSIEDEELNELEAKAESMDWDESVAAHFTKEMRKLERFPANSPEYGIQYTYLETLLDLPWNKYSKDQFNLRKVRRILDADHYGLEKVKERIVEQMAVLKLRGDMKAPILCLYGPPGVGKTSLGKSIASAIGREYARVALGGVHDEAEIRGHRRTYVGAMPGRIIAALGKVGTSNPVFVLDEIDKIACESKGDPSTALLEVLDPEQNSKFHDNYLNIDYDLSHVMFIATANDLSTISRPLLDRMELIEIPGYVSEEKVAIARAHLLPKVLEEHGLSKGALTVTKDALIYIIDRYTHESGVRQLEKQLARLIRKIAVKEADGDAMMTKIGVHDVRELLGPELEDPEQYEGNAMAGVATGLAWTAAGGEILFIEVSLSPGKGKLTLTGQLGDVMKESAIIALEYIKAHASILSIDMALFDAYDIHLHVPEGAIPKDGPSAGVTIVSALASAFTRRRIAPSLAMSGEITLRGKVLPVGGIKEKILAGSRAGIKNIILSRQNKKDIEQIPHNYIKHLTFKYIDSISELLDIALTNEIDTFLPERVNRKTDKNVK